MAARPNNDDRIFVGYDAREAAAFSVLSHSIHRRASQPVSVAL